MRPVSLTKTYKNHVQIQIAVRVFHPHLIVHVAKCIHGTVKILKATGSLQALQHLGDCRTLVS